MYVCMYQTVEPAVDRHFTFTHFCSMYRGVVVVVVWGRKGKGEEGENNNDEIVVGQW